MKKSDLKTGMRVETRNGQLFTVIKDVDTIPYGHQEIAFIDEIGNAICNKYSDDLMKDNNSISDWDVIRVYDIKDNNISYLTVNMLDLYQRYLIWEREEFPRLGDMYYYPSIDVNSGYEESVYYNDSMDNNRKSRVGIYETREEAINRARELAWIK